MRVECPYCAVVVDVRRLEAHVRMMDGDGHGQDGDLPIDGVDSPWNLRLDVPDDVPDDADVPTVDLDPTTVREGRCPACDRGGLGLAGGGGFLSRGRRRIVCIHCGWESPDWITIRD